MIVQRQIHPALCLYDLLIREQSTQVFFQRLPFHAKDPLTLHQQFILWQIGVSVCGRRSQYVEHPTLHAKLGI